MQGLDDWRFPNQWSTIDGDRVVLRWTNRLPGQRDDGSFYEVPGVSLMTYAGGGKFSYEEDIINMAHLGEVLTESGYRFADNMNPPPRNPPR
jgi:hypothetical protein